MRKKEAVERLCSLVTKVGEHFNHKHAHDCICGANKMSDLVLDSEILNFIEDAVEEKLMLPSSNG